MHINPMIKDYRYTAPLLYFLAIILWMYFGNLFHAQEAEPLILLFCIPFLYQLVFRNRLISIVLAMFMLVWAVWMLMAYASEYTQLASHSSEGMVSFMLTGGVFILLNFVMAIWLFPIEMGKA
jgi:hypothetical protein